MNYIAEKWQALLEDREPAFGLPPLPRKPTPDEALEDFCQEVRIDSSNLMQEICEVCYSGEKHPYIHVWNSLTERWGSPEGPGDSKYFGEYTYEDRVFEFIIVDGVSNGTVLEEWQEITDFPVGDEDAKV